MHKFISINPKCICGEELKIISLHINLEDCSYVLLCECTVCKEETTIILDIDEFIELSQKLNLTAPPDLLGEGSEN